MKALITGITGFVGSHLAEHLLGEGIEVTGTMRSHSSLRHIRHLLPDMCLYECELMDPQAVERMMADIRPDLIFHLAAQSFVPLSWESPAETMTNNIIGQVHLLEAVRKLGLASKVLIACSSEEYGHVEEDEVPVKETNPLRPISPYAVSKIAQDYLGYQYFKTYGQHIVRTRTFNHHGPRRGAQFVSSNFAKQIAEIEKGLKPPVLHVGNLEAKRDFTDVRDVVRAYRMALNDCEAGEIYNIASGQCHEIREVIQILLSYSTVDITIEEDKTRLRPSDVKVLVGDYGKFYERTGWKPEIPFEQTMKDLLDYWRNELA
ncbi:GDP-4-dehydro-6-deoxy-D-mannose reductase [Paenibacillus sp. BK033]|uniref:GDP-mannose 4,6-dehydratase n=1 Tax=Paenibacillus sp. BK033 TaxID=2512133 RepID=UPI0010468644|nr:GDP-mannose 4,6-dehydratase [Paenibacillus sp. BK033]TCM98956.1 GDP-4-dehydro-6-deoxy-D-mannose reductase [Paenibacillus sp. BK033]